MKTGRCIGLAMLLLVVSTQSLRAGRVEADPNKDYPLSKNCGPWMIMVTSFYARPQGHGVEQAREATYQQAKELVLELRRDFNIPAYTYQMHTNFGKDLPTTRRARPQATSVRLRPGDVGDDLHLTSAGLNRVASLTDAYDEPSTRRVREFDQVAVLAGNYATLDQARRVADEKIRDWYPRSMQRFVKTLMDNEMWLRVPKGAKGPLWRAFPTPNPFVPKDYLQAQEPDELLHQMNAGPLSLYKCPGRYSVLVATFAGRTRIDYRKSNLDAFVNKLETEDTDRLQRAAVEAEALARALRKKRWQAYVFHDRNSSIVTVGSFNNESDPMIEQTIKVFRAELKGNQPQPRMKRLGRWQFNHKPLPVTVPRPS